MRRFSYYGINVTVTLSDNLNCGHYMATAEYKHKDVTAYFDEAYLYDDCDDSDDSVSLDNRRAAKRAIMAKIWENKHEEFHFQ